MLRLIAISLALTVGAEAETRGEWYKSLTLPGQYPGFCCSEADCRAAEAHPLAGGRWEVDVTDPKSGQPQNFKPVPDAAIVQSTATWDGRPYVCVVGGEVRCFVKPGGGA